MRPWGWTSLNLGRSGKGKELDAARGTRGCSPGGRGKAKGESVREEGERVGPCQWAQGSSSSTGVSTNQDGVRGEENSQVWPWGKEARSDGTTGPMPMGPR